ncbi:diguanylate cyclase domain-containing protein [Paraburkholderia sp. Cpub6]|uniref:GGDEF domain-containing protein n=1 Tax=Paraburkholderia sp. Cpub6 TaxID=2723094 RepID=UPI0017BE8185|nr:PleD family two-component response regulator [Paraburkholderia sp. Cpub6]
MDHTHCYAAMLRALVAASVARAPTGDVACTLSAGVDEFGDGDTVASVMARADTALYAAKANGRNCVMLAGSSQRADDIVSSFPA